MSTVTTCMETAPAIIMTPEPGVAPAARKRRLFQLPATIFTAWRRHALPPWNRTSLFCLAAATLSGALLWMCFHPLSLGSYLGWIALVPFLFLVRCQSKPWFLYDCAWVCGVVFFLPSLEWMRYADLRMYATWAMLAVYCSLYLPAALFLIRRLERWRIPMVLTVPLVWVALEYLRSFLMTGFTWYFLAHTQHDVLSMIQITDLGGVYMVTFLVAAVNAFVFDCLYQSASVRSWFRQAELDPQRFRASFGFLNRALSNLTIRRNLVLECVVLSALVAGAWGYGIYRLNEGPFFRGPTVCLLQSDLDQRIREFAATNHQSDSHQVVARHYAELCSRAVTDFIDKPDLIIWPETSYPHPWVEISPKVPIQNVPTEWRDHEIDIRNRLFDLGATYTHIPHLLGINTYQMDENSRRHYNSALLLNAQGRVEARFDKMHRVPFGEYVPLKDWLPFMNSLAPYEFDYSVQPGKKFTRFKIKQHSFGVVICYEDSDPLLARQYVQNTEDGPPVDFLVNISNDGWFDGSREHEEHLAVSRFRAIECRRAMVRAVNMGVSALIDSNGRILKPGAPIGSPPVWIVHEENGRFPELPLADWRKFKHTAGILTATIPIDHRSSFYAIWGGDWLPIGCWLSLALATVGGWCMRRPQTIAPAIGV